MNNFRLVGAVDPGAMLQDIAAHPELWDSNRARTAHPDSPHREASDIILRQNPAGLHGTDALRARNARDVAGDLSRVDYPAMQHFARSWSLIRRGLIAALIDRNAIGLGSVVIARLRPGGRIHWHRDYDGGSAGLYYDRFQAMLAGHQMFTVDDETCCMSPGEVWWFDNAKRHSVVNTGGVDRIALIVDLRLRYPMARTAMLPDGMMRSL